MKLIVGGTPQISLYYEAMGVTEAVPSKKQTSKQTKDPLASFLLSEIFILSHISTHGDSSP